MRDRNRLQMPVCFPVSSHCLLPLVLQEQKSVPASGELSSDLQEWSPYSPGHSSRHSNPPFYPSRASVGELAGQGRAGEEGRCGLPGPPSPRESGDCHFRELLCVLKDLATADLSGVFSLLSVTSFSFSECFLPIAAWEMGSTEEGSPALQVEQGQKLA